MRPLLTREEARTYDRDAGEQLGVPTLLLMENAGRAAADVLRIEFPHALERVLILGGTGQNGGDGWVVARQLVSFGHRPRCVLIGERDQVRGDAAQNLEILTRMGVSVIEYSSAGGHTIVERELSQATLVIDALFGTGLTRPIEGEIARVITALNTRRTPRVALDLPSGVDADTGQALGAAVQAELTLTFGAAKRGLYQHPGAALAGRIQVLSLGVPPPSALATSTFLFERDDALTQLRRRPQDMHKNRAGHVVVVAGSEGKVGALRLAGLGAARGGAGLVTLASPRLGRSELECDALEAMTLELSLRDVHAAARSVAERADAVVLGPGLGIDDATALWIRELTLALCSPLVLDADALTAWSNELDTLRAAPATIVLTPHPGEAARMLGTTNAAVQANRFEAARALAERSGATVVLKGAGTIVAQHERPFTVVARGSPAMATAGAGDVLAGIIGALGCELELPRAAAVGAWLHAVAGETAAAGADRGLLAHEIAEQLPAIMAEFRGTQP